MARTSIKRPSVSDQVEESAQVVLSSLKGRLSQKGSGTFLSRHEILGVVVEEYQELIEAVHMEGLDDVRAELIDIAVAAIFGVACIDKGGVEW